METRQLETETWQVTDPVMVRKPKKTLGQEHQTPQLGLLKISTFSKQVSLIS